LSAPEPVPNYDGAADWRRWVVYQIYPRSFADSDGDGVGDLRGIIGHVGYLHRLGVDVVWLSPVYRSPMDDNGYDISDYQDIDPLFGSLADLDELIAELHARGMKLVMDLVVNHTSDEHPWFVESRSSRDNPKRDWYWWRDAPTNWESHFSGPTWTFDEKTGQYYLHIFSAKQPDLNWENPEVRQAIYAMMRWWLDRGVDGFRMDVINMISKDTSLPDTTPRPGSPYGPGDQFFTNGPRNHEFLQEMHAAVFAGRDAHVLTVGEMPGVTIPEAVLFTDPARHELDMVFQFQHVQLDVGANKFDLRPLHLPDLKAAMADWQRGLAERGWNSLYFGNHDQPRSVSRFGDDSAAHRVASAKTLATVLHLHRGTPYVYQGDELAMANAPFAAITDFRDIQTLRYYAEAAERAERDGTDLPALLAAMARMSRDQGRTPVQWDASPGAGFTTGTPWLAINPDHTTVNAAAQVGDPGSVFEHYRRLIALRHEDPVVTDGDFELLLPEHPAIWAFLRRTPDAELLVAANFSADVVDADLALDADWADASVVLTSLDGDSPLQAPPGLKLRPWESVVWRRTLS
jgi:oligo-1,6-glucosidase